MAERQTNTTHNQKDKKERERRERGNKERRRKKQRGGKRETEREKVVTKELGWLFTVCSAQLASTQPVQTDELDSG